MGHCGAKQSQEGGLRRKSGAEGELGEGNGEVRTMELLLEFRFTELVLELREYRLLNTHTHTHTNRLTLPVLRNV